MIGACLAYFHPTTVVGVDDNEHYLANIELLMPDTAIFRGFVDPHEALEYCNSFSQDLALADSAFSIVEVANFYSLVRVNREVIENEVSNALRFEFPSVLITDYAMPSMTGVDLCRGVGDVRIMKMLITGVTDEREAVKAFNSNTIESFVMKGDASAVHQIAEGVAALQYRSFLEEQRTLLAAIAVGGFSFLREEVIGSYLRHLVLSGGCTEYYLSTDPVGYLLVSSTGDMRTLVVIDDLGMDEMIRKAIRHGAPTSVVHALEARTHGVSLTEKEVESASSEDWVSALIALEILQGETNWYLGVTDVVPLDVDYDSSKTSVETYRGR